MTKKKLASPRMRRLHWRSKSWCLSREKSVCGGNGEHARNGGGCSPHRIWPETEQRRLRFVNTWRHACRRSVKITIFPSTCFSHETRTLIPFSDGVLKRWTPGGSTMFENGVRVSWTIAVAPYLVDAFLNMGKLYQQSFGWQMEFK